MANRLNLILHCGANKVDREQVDALPAPAPKTETHFPIPHKTLVDMLYNRLPAYGLQVVQEAHALTKDGNRYFGMFQVENGQNSDEFGMVIGLRNAHDMTFRAGLTLGSGVFVCDNLAFNGEVVVGRRHTKNVLTDLPLLMSKAVGRIVEARVNQTNRIAKYHESDLTLAEADHLIVEAWKAGAIPPTAIAKVAAEYREPRHEEFKPRNVFSLWNAFTEVHKGRNLMDMPPRTTRLHGLLDSHCGLIVDAKAAVREDFADMVDVEVN